MIKEKKIMAVVGALIGLFFLFGMIAISDAMNFGLEPNVWIFAPVAMIFTAVVICAVNEADESFEEEDY